MIRLDDVTKSFPGTSEPAVDGLSLPIAAGEIVTLVGPSGCGKTTTLKMINRIIEPTSGTITVDGEDVRSRPAHELRRGIGYVIQQIGLLPHKTIEDNVTTVPRLLGWDDQRQSDRAHELMELMDLDQSMLSRYPSELSGGQRQRVGVARALAADPPVLLMDEPFGAVDPIVRRRLQEQLLGLQEELGKTIVFVTHDIDEAIALGDRVAILNVGGHLAQYATPTELLSNPADDFVVDFLGDERALRRLSLLHVADLELAEGPVVAANASAADARAAADDYDANWVGVTDDERLRGWLWTSELVDGKSAGDHDTRDFRVWIRPEDSLRTALDAIVSSRNNVAVVSDGQSYHGMLFVEQVTAELLA
ncbi:ABC transporter ATP-binding protein [Nitriliruptoria bacterium AS10]|nr:ABC transporter ATP-binding protein [Salsipaludibacter albus]MBY5162822.1 ABC transporter ATP-binding protein [Salsipaludibacter albus]